jgi:hypothetical protein
VGQPRQPVVAVLARVNVAGLSATWTARPVSTSFTAALWTAPGLAFFAPVPSLALSMSLHSSPVL